MSEEERVRRAKGRAADQMAAYIEQRRREIAAGSPRLIDIATRSFTTGPDLAGTPAPPVESEARAEQSKLEETVRETGADYGKRRSYEETESLLDH